MSDWLHNLPVPSMALVIFGSVYSACIIIYGIVLILARGNRLRAFKAVSPGILSPLGTLFALFVAFTAAQVWADTDRATAAVDHEAGALSKVLFLATSFPGPSAAQLSELIGQYIGNVVNLEWPEMARHSNSLMAKPRPLDEALTVTLALTPSSRGQEIAQNEMVEALEAALDARRQRIVISQAQVNPVKWSCLLAQAFCTFLIIAIVHSENRLAGGIGMGTFATGVAVSLLLIATHDRPFTGEISVHPAPLLNLLPEIASTRND